MCDQGDTYYSNNICFVDGKLDTKEYYYVIDS